MNRNNDTPMWVVAGVAGSVGIGIMLVPLRNSVSASNLAFLFVAFTIIVAELGGRLPALITAIMSAVSLNFFLTQPYLTLNIEKKEDLIAFFAMVGCGMIAAGFGRRRQRFTEDAQRTANELDVLQRLVDQLRDHIPLEEILVNLRSSFRLGGLVLRNAKEQVVAAAPKRGPWRTPHTNITPDTLFSPDAVYLRMGERGFRLPEDGGRLQIGGGKEGYLLDLWEGDAEGLNLDERQTLGVAAYLLMCEAARRSA